MTIDPSTVVSGLSGLAKLVTEIMGAKRTNERDTLFSEFQKGMIHAQARELTQLAENLALLERNNDLEQQIVKFKSWETEKLRYSLVNPGALGFVYSLKESVKGSEPSHWICATCYQEGKKSILHTLNNDGWPLIACPSCKTEIRSGSRGIPVPQYTPD